MALPTPSVPIQSTAGAVPIKNEKGDLTMQKVKVQRYVTGKRPDFAPQESSDEEEEFDFVRGQKRQTTMPAPRTDTEKADRRLRRLQERQLEDDDEEDEEESREKRLQRRRQFHEPELLGRSSDEEEAEVEVRREEHEESSEEEELDDEEIEARRMLLRQKVRQQREEEELMDKEEDKEEEGSEEESSEYEEYTDSEEEETGPRLKPVFVRKKDRITIQEKEREEERKRELVHEAESMSLDRRRHTIKMIVDEARKEQSEKENNQAKLGDIDTDEDNDEEEYEAWKVRELKRIKRDREERENAEKDKLELERVHNMTEEERRLEFKNSPHLVTNKASKGKYKYLQKYYHRGAFFMDEEADVYKRDFSAPTLEDHFNKTTLPKVMQVKNFGRSGRTKYTHLVDQDTTQFDSPWSDAAASQKFATQKGGGLKQTFERPSVQKRK